MKRSITRAIRARLLHKVLGFGQREAERLGLDIGAYSHGGHVNWNRAKVGIRCMTREEWRREFEKHRAAEQDRNARLDREYAVRYKEGGA